MSYNEIAAEISNILSSRNCDKEVWEYLRELAIQGKIQLESED